MTEIWKAYRPHVIFCLLTGGLFVLIFLMDPGSWPLTEEPPPADSEEARSVERPVPDFAGILDAQLRKQTFFDFMEPYVAAANAEILGQRERLEAIHQQLLAGDELDAQDLGFLSALGEQYEVETEDLTSLEFLAALLLKVDVIPVSLALAQAANESAWGTSRFARLGNSFFGQWCYGDDCGLVPGRRAAGATHKVRSFASAAESVRAYMLNLNTFPSYRSLWEIRRKLRQQGLPIDGISLSEGLESYSERGAGYIRELQAMIRGNDLLRRENITL